MPSDATTGPDGEPVVNEPIGAEPLAEGDATDFDDEFGDGLDALAEEEAAAPVPVKTRLLGIVLGLVVAVVGAVVYALLTLRFEKRLALTGVIAGILIGLVVRRVGKLDGVKGGVIAGVLAIFGAFLGMFFGTYTVQKHAKIQPIVDWTVQKQWEAWGFKTGWENFTDALDGLSWLTVALAGAAAFIYASDSGKKKPVEVDEDELSESDAFGADSELEPPLPESPESPAEEEEGGPVSRSE